MKKTAIALALMAVTVTAGAQRNDLYSTGAKSKAAPSVASSSVTRVPVQTDAFDIDNYNRRYSSVQAASTNSADATDSYNTVYIHDTVFYMMESSSSRSELNSYSYNEGYTDAVEDFYATRLISRFHRHGLTLALALDPFYYDSWYWDSWYYDPWYYNPWYYDRWYYPSYHYHYSYSRPVYVVKHSVTAPNRHVNSGRGNGWDRNLSGGSTKGSTRSVTSASGRSVGTPVNTTTRNVGVQRSAERRGTASSTGTRGVSSTTGFDRPSSTGTRNVSTGTSQNGNNGTGVSRSVSRSVSGNGNGSTGTGNRGENVQNRNVQTQTNSRQTNTSRQVSTSPRSTSSSTGNTATRSSSNVSSGRSVSAGPSMNTSSGGTGQSRGMSGSASRR